jgi:hypothetical protein
MYLVLEINGRVEVGDFGVYRFAEHFVFAVVDEFSHFLDVLAIAFAASVCERTDDSVWGSE